MKRKWIGMNLNELDAMISDINSAKSVEINGEKYVSAKELKEIISMHFKAGNMNFRKRFGDCFYHISSMYEDAISATKEIDNIAGKEDE